MIHIVLFLIFCDHKFYSCSSHKSYCSPYNCGKLTGNLNGELRPDIFGRSIILDINALVKESAFYPLPVSVSRITNVIGFVNQESSYLRKKTRKKTHYSNRNSIVLDEKRELCV